MRILILGGSSIARKRLIPALSALPAIERVAVASRSTAGLDYPDYGEALEQSDAELVYVSLVNSEHAIWAERALDAGRHVIVDKPAFLDVETAARLVERSRERGLCLAEATVYTRHPQVDAVRALFDAPAGGPATLVAAFSFPPLPDGDFRYRRALGGGALNDLGPYAATPGRLFFGGRPEEVHCRALSTGGPDGVETAFDVCLRYAGGRSLVGHFGFTTAYRNRLSVLGAGCCVDVDRFYTTPPDLENEIHVFDQQGRSTKKAPAADAFGRYVQEVVDRIGSGDLEPLRAELLDDATVLDAMRRSAEVG